MTRTMRNNIIIVVIVVLLSCIAGFAAAKYLLKDTAEDKKENKTNEVDESKKEIEKEVQKTIKKEYTLFNTEATLSGICNDVKTTCNKDIGKFELNGVVHTASINYDLTDPDNSKLLEQYSEKYPDDTNIQTLKYVVMNDPKSNYINIDYKKLSIEPLSVLDKIVKIDDKYLAIGTDEGQDINYKIRIYDSGLNLVKTYESIHDAASTSFSEYFNVNKNTFTRYSCVCDSNSNDQTLEKYRVTVENGKFTESKISEIKTYCTPQCK